MTGGHGLAQREDEGEHPAQGDHRDRHPHRRHPPIEVPARLPPKARTQAPGAPLTPGFGPPHDPAPPTVCPTESSARAAASALSVSAKVAGPGVGASTVTRHNSPALPTATRAP
ncbi:hypothetical protein ABID94_002751 [Streptomyces sp. PvR018]